MKSDATRYALATIYTALTEAADLATGKPVGRLSDYLIREMVDGDTPPEAAKFLTHLAESQPDNDEAIIEPIEGGQIERAALLLIESLAS